MERVLPSSISQAWWHHHSVRFIITIGGGSLGIKPTLRGGEVTQKAVSHAETGPGPQYTFSLTPHTAPSLFLWGLFNSQTTGREKRRINWKDVKKECHNKIIRNTYDVNKRLSCTHARSDIILLVLFLDQQNECWFNIASDQSQCSAVTLLQRGNTVT